MIKADNPPSFSANINSIDKMREFGRKIASCLKPGDTICLRGELGAGKTTMAQEIIATITGINNATSPTFAIMQTYEGNGSIIRHYDLYRISSPQELPELGLDDDIDSTITLIEWPDIAKEYLPDEPVLNMHIEYGDSDGDRVITAFATGNLKDRLTKIL